MYNYNTEHFEREKGWVAPMVEVTVERDNIFAHFDFVREERTNGMSEDMEGAEEQKDNGMESYTACYIRVPHKAQYEAIRDEIIANGCDDAEAKAKEIVRLLTEAGYYNE